MLRLVVKIKLTSSVGWTGPYPVLSRKKPTASLVSRKVLTPLLGQVIICVLLQLVGFETVQKQPWFVEPTVGSPWKLTDCRYIPPHLDKEKSNVENSQNTTLFLLSCYQYILSGIVLSTGPPFRQSLAQNRKSTQPMTNGMSMVLKSP